jgi:hypothetical protein
VPLADNEDALYNGRLFPATAYMKNVSTTVILSLQASLAWADLGSQFYDPLDGKFDASNYLSENAAGFLPVPIIITEPAVDGGLGMMGIIFHEDDVQAEKRKRAMRTSENPSKHLLPPNVSALMGAYTGNESWLVGGGHMGFLKQGRIRYAVGVGYGDIDLDYYSLGDVNLSRPLTINTEAAFLMQSLKFKVADWPLYIGPLQRYIDTQVSPGNDIAEVLPPGTPGDIVDIITDLTTVDVSASGLGLEIEYDLRDNFFTPQSGHYLDFKYAAYRDAIGSDLDYDWYEFTGYSYFRMSDHWRLGLRLALEAADSDDALPPFALPAISMRGIPAARYQGNYVGALEGEVTWQPNLRWGVLGFVGAGRAAFDSSDFGSSPSQISQGIGFRYQLARLYGLHVGLDVARGPEDTVWYIQVGSAW